TCGGPQSNHARATAVAAAKLGLKSHLVLRNSVAAQMEGNAFLSRLVGAEVTNVSAEEYMRIDEVMQRIADEAREQGHKPYVIPEGGSNELGVLGYVKAVEETLAQLKRSKTKVHHVFVAVGSGGTYAGLLLGKHLFDFSAEIHGINVCDSASYFEGRILRLLKETKKRFGLEVSFTKKDLHILDGYVGKGYGLSSQEEIDLIKTIARTEGVVLDPVYTGKAMLGMVDQIRQGRFKAGETLLFFHTGGIYGLFPKRSLFF
ncbi:MAG: pyridoxal-phosphate dependent enzyme, partial [Calditrichaeota bacterium]